MYRCLVFIFLLPCLLMSQSASFGHVHSGHQPLEHNLRPHLHLNTAQSTHKHEHHHHHGDDSHHHPHDEMPGDNAQATGTTESEPLSNHDSTAVYVDAIDVINHVNPTVFELDQRSVLVAESKLAILAYYPVREAISCHSPPGWDQHCPLYVQHLTLVI